MHFAVWLCYRHNQGAADHGKPPTHHPMSIVTALVDRIGKEKDMLLADLLSDFCFISMAFYLSSILRLDHTLVRVVH